MPSDLPPSLRLRAQAVGSALDARRGVVRVSPATMVALGLEAWDTVRLTPAGAGRTAGAPVAAAPPGTHPFALLVDDVVLENLGVGDGSDVDVGPAPTRPCERLVLRLPPVRQGLAERVPPDTARLALLGRVVGVGDTVSLVPQDFALPPGVDPISVGRAAVELRAAVGSDWQQVPFTVDSCDPAEFATVTMTTVVQIHGGGTTSTSATPGLRRPGRAPSAGTPAADRRWWRLWEPSSSPLGGSGAPPSGAGTVSAPAPAAGTAPVATTASGTAPALEPPASPEPPPGLDGPFRALTEWLDLDFHHRDLLSRLGSGRRLGVLVTGPAGSGKVSLVRSAAAAVGAGVVQVWGPSLASAGDAALARLRAAADAASASGPSVLLVEDVDAVAGTDPLASHPALLAELRSRVADPDVAVVCTTARPEDCDPRLREPGLLEREVEVPLLTRDQRRAALGELTAGVPLEPDVDLGEVAARTPGFVLADLVSLVHEAGVRAAHRHRGRADSTDSADSADDSADHSADRSADDETREAAGDGSGGSVAAVDVDAALSVVSPSAAEGGSLETPDLTLDDVGDMDTVKAALTETVLWPLTHPDTFSRLGVEPARGVLLYGPPGCGKTFLVRALAGTGQVTIFPVKGAEVLSKWVGESERGVREVFRRARQSVPALVFLDEIDALAPRRGQSSDSGVSDRVVAALLTELDGVDELAGVSVVGATNRPDLVDPAVLRPGRLGRLVFVPPPDAEARTAILRSSARRTPLADDVDLAELGARTEGYSAADCAALVREAALTAMRRSMTSSEVTAADVEAALGTVRPSLDPVQVASIEAFATSREAG